MGLILPQEVEVGIQGAAQDYYREKGYDIPLHYDNVHNMWVAKRGLKIMVDVSDLPCGSTVKVKCKCDMCGQIYFIAKSAFIKNVMRNDGKYICKNKSLHIKIDSNNRFSVMYDELATYCKKHNRFPKFDEYTSENGFTFSYATSGSICKDNSTTLNDVLNEIDCFKTQCPSVKCYEKYINKLKDDISCDNKIAENLYAYFRRDNVGLPDIRWLIDNCPDKEVTDTQSFKKFLGLYDRFISKNDCIEIIRKMVVELDRPLMYNDFRGAGYGKVTVHMINEYWGSLNKMKKDLGLEIVQKDMITRSPSEDELISAINKLVRYAKSLNKTFLTEREIVDFCKKNNCIGYLCMDKWCKKYFERSFSKVLHTKGISMSNPGIGIVNDFDDGERTTSQFEYMFSVYLRNRGLVYDKDYFRDVRYSSIDKNYNGLMNCDYVIQYNERKIYVEIAGLIEYYKQWYYSNKSINSSKSKEKYRRKLYEKELMFKRNNLTYFILFPCDLTADILDSVLESPTVSLRKEIEKRYKNNIDWRIIQKTGQLKYLDVLGKDGQPIVDYGEAI